MNPLQAVELLYQAAMNGSVTNSRAAVRDQIIAIEQAKAMLTQVVSVSQPAAPSLKFPRAVEEPLVETVAKD